jgi:predicted nucleotidyltransferase
MEPGVRAQLAIDREQLRVFCERHGIRRLAWFGSVLRSDFRPDSDVDALVEFSPEASPDLFDMVRMQDELSGIVGRAVDLRTPAELSRYFRDRVCAEAEVAYERG